jgi:hypothetical protein
MIKVSKFVLGNLELILAGMSIPVVVLIHLFVSSHFDNPWKITCTAAVTVGVLHGVLGWLVRQRQRTVRLELLQRIAAILQEDPQLIGHLPRTQPGPTTEYAVRLALAQLPALVREPLSVRTIAVREPSGVLHGQSV